MANHDYLSTQSVLRIGKPPRKSTKLFQGNVRLILLQSYFSDPHYQTAGWVSAHHKASPCNKNTHYNSAIP